MFDPKSDYALNKMTPDAIVYIDSNGISIRVTSNDFSSLEEFLRWKVWSDEDYHTTEKEDHIFANHKSSLSEQTAAIRSPEDILVDALEEQERQELCRLLMEGLDGCLTRTQHRRLWLHCIHRLTVRQIALTENVNFQNVAKSISAAKKKLKKFLGEQGDKTPF